MLIWYGYFDKFGETKGKKIDNKRSNKIKVFEANKSLYP